MIWGYRGSTTGALFKINVDSEDPDVVHPRNSGFTKGADGEGDSKAEGSQCDTWEVYFLPYTRQKM